MDTNFTKLTVRYQKLHKASIILSICMLQISGQIVFRVTFPTVYIGKFNRQISHDNYMGNKINKCTNIDMKMHEYHEILSTYELFNFKSKYGFRPEAVCL